MKFNWRMMIVFYLVCFIFAISNTALGYPWLKNCTQCYDCTQCHLSSTSTTLKITTTTIKLTTTTIPPYLTTTTTIPITTSTTSASTTTTIPIGHHKINGSVFYQSNNNGIMTDTPLCAMVLANGQYMFTCDKNNMGNYQMAVPADKDGLITVFSFCEGMMPAKVILNPKESVHCQMSMFTPADNYSEMTVTSNLSPLNSIYFRLSGKVTYQGIPLCAMILANGQYMFTCQGNGEYDLNVPLDENGEITLFCFCDGLLPFKKILKP